MRWPDSLWEWPKASMWCTRRWRILPSYKIWCVWRCRSGMHPTGCRPTIAHVRSANNCGNQDTGASPPHARIDHKVAGSREAIEAAQATLRDVPPYSPELSPIESCESKVKSRLHTRAARTPEVLAQAWTEVRASITPSDARHGFAHCGYRTAPN